MSLVMACWILRMQRNPISHQWRTFKTCINSSGRPTFPKPVWFHIVIPTPNSFGCGTARWAAFLSSLSCYEHKPYRKNVSGSQYDQAVCIEMWAFKDIMFIGNWYTFSTPYINANEVFLTIDNASLAHRSWAALLSMDMEVAGEISTMLLKRTKLYVACLCLCSDF